MAELEDGKSFKEVAKKYSIDEASKSQGGKLPAVAKGQQEKALDEAVFKAKKGELTGPVKTQFGYYVFEVDEDHRRPTSRRSRSRRSRSAPSSSRRRSSTRSTSSSSTFQEKYREEDRVRRRLQEGPRAAVRQHQEAQGRRHPAAGSRRARPGQDAAPPQGGAAAGRSAAGCRRSRCRRSRARRSSRSRRRQVPPQQAPRSVLLARVPRHAEMNADDERAGPTPARSSLSTP